MKQLIRVEGLTPKWSSVSDFPIGTVVIVTEHHRPDRVNQAAVVGPIGEGSRFRTLIYIQDALGWDEGHVAAVRELRPDETVVIKQV